MIFARNADPSGYGLKGMLPAPLSQVSFKVVCQRKVVRNAGSTLPPSGFGRDSSPAAALQTVLEALLLRSLAGQHLLRSALVLLFRRA